MAGLQQTRPFGHVAHGSEDGPSDPCPTSRCFEISLARLKSWKRVEVEDEGGCLEDWTRGAAEDGLLPRPLPLFSHRLFRPSIAVERAPCGFSASNLTAPSYASLMSQAAFFLPTPYLSSPRV